MEPTGRKTGAERGSAVLVVVLYIAVAIAALSFVSSSRVVAETNAQGVLEGESRALNAAFAQIHLAMNVVTNSAYDGQNRNLELRAAVAGDNGGTVAGATQTEPLYTTEAEETAYGSVAWLDSTVDPPYGFLVGTNVRVYAARDYVQRIQRLRDTTIAPVDPTGLSDSYFVLEAAGRNGDVVRLVSALVRENEPFSSFVFFQNRGTLGISGAPRGLIHANESIDFYFPDGLYQDDVSSVEGFGFQAGATPDNTSLMNANPEARRIDLAAVDFEDLKSKADFFVGQDGLDAEILFTADGQARIQEFTPPYFEMVTQSRTDETEELVKVGEQEVTYEEEVIDHWIDEDYWTTEQVQIGENIEDRTRDVEVQVGTEEVVHTRTEPIYEWQTVTRYRSVQVWVPYNSGADGGTSVGGGGAGELGEYEWVQEPYDSDEQVQVGEEIIEYTVTEPVFETVTEDYTVTVPVFEDQDVLKTRQIPVYVTVTQTRMEDIYEWQEVEKEIQVNDYEPVTTTWDEEVWNPPTLVDTTYVQLSGTDGGMIYIDGRITSMEGELQGRLTVVGNEKIRVTGNIQYVDDDGDTAMLNGTDYREVYERNPDYDARNVLGVIARDDIVFTHELPSSTELTGTFLAAQGRVGIDAFWADSTGELHPDSESNRETYLTAEQREKERAYDRHSDYKTMPFVKNSLRRTGGLISNNRIMETYVTMEDGSSQVTAGFKRGNMKFDISLLHNPPPNFVVVPRPVLTYYAPVLAVRDDF
jgi:hypothetical protein